MSFNPYESPEFASDVAPAKITQLKLASRLSRLAAAIIDSIIVSGVSWLFLFILATAVGESRVGDAGPYLIQIVGVGFSTGVYLALNCYYLAQNGQTIGKKLLGIRIVRTSGEPATLACIIGKRFLPLMLIGLIPCIGGLVGLIDALMIFRESRQCLHDEFADTIVVMA